MHFPLFDSLPASPNLLLQLHPYLLWLNICSAQFPFLGRKLPRLGFYLWRIRNSGLQFLGFNFYISISIDPYTLAPLFPSLRNLDLNQQLPIPAPQSFLEPGPADFAHVIRAQRKYSLTFFFFFLQEKLLHCFLQSYKWYKFSAKN